ncbi:NAD(+) synthase [Candidatus Saccharibacteria bacterium]|nr:NAD(+) synthase [Candidatus Saccharibacteria bacterium]
MKSIKKPEQAPFTTLRRVAVLTPEVIVGDTSTNADRIIDLYTQAVHSGVAAAVTPELAVTSYSLADGFALNATMNQVKAGLLKLANATKNTQTTLIVGTPIEFENKLYNCAVVLSGGKIIGIVPKQYLANYSEFYEQRWFTSGKDIANSSIELGGAPIPFGTDLLFKIGDITCGIEICEDLWVADPPSRKLAQAGAEVIFNLSSSTEIVGKGAIRRALVSQTADRLLCCYVYASSDSSESTADVIMSGHALISEFDWILAERKPLSEGNRVLIADIDITHIRRERRKNQSWEPKGMQNFQTLGSAISPQPITQTVRPIDPHPFTPSDTVERHAVSRHILNLQAHGLKKRMAHIASGGTYPKILLGLSGGLDSTLALLAATRACDLLGVPRKTIHTLTMPAYASSERTQDNASLLAQAIGTTHEVIPIQKLVDAQLKLLGHDGKTQDIAYENVQARARTELLFNRSNQVGGLVLGTGDLSELALGWCTYNGDHMSNYAVNAGIPKTLVRYIVETASLDVEFKDAKTILEDILDTPVSPELTGNGTLSQETENLIGPYELHDFFIYHLLRWGNTRTEILRLAQSAFSGDYDEDEITKWLNLFCKRFITQQFKRNCMPDGVKVGRVALSPRGDLRFPSDASINMLLK